MIKTKAFTLIELMIVVAIVGLLSLVGAPYFRAYLSNAESGSVNNRLMIDIMYTRNQAISNGREFQIIPLDGTLGNGVLADEASSSGVNWGAGWQIFDTGDAGANPIIPPRITKTQLAFSNDVFIRSTGASALDSANAISFNRNGILVGNGGSLTIGVLGCAGNNASIIDINQVGQVITTDIACPIGFADLCNYG